MFEMDKSCERLRPTEDDLSDLLATSSKSDSVLEDYQAEATTNIYYGFEDDDDVDDEVFEDFDEMRKTSKTEVVRNRRTRRDVIDSLGELSPSPSTKHLSYDFSDNRSYGQIEEKNVVIVRREETKHFHMSHGSGAVTVPDYMSPPRTPLSDYGYGGSTGMPTPSSPSTQLVYFPRWARFSNSSVDACSPPKLNGDTMDAKPLAKSETTALAQQMEATMSSESRYGTLEI